MERHARDDPEAQTGFFFALQTLTRSSSHRTVLAIALALGLTHALIVLARIGGHSMEIQPAPAAAFAIAVTLILTLLGGIAHTVHVPATPEANWTIQMAWLGDERQYMAEVKRAAIVLVMTVLAILLPLHVALLGPGLSVVHSLLVLLLASTSLDLLLLSYRKLPFACSYVPFENPKIVWPAALVSLLLVSYGFANAERWALQAPWRAVALAVALGACALLVRTVDSAQRRERRPVDFDGQPRPATQRLGLLDHIGIYR